MDLVSPIDEVATLIYSKYSSYNIFPKFFYTHNR